MIQQPDPALDLTISRVIAAPRRVVWNSWADPAQLAQWWIPKPARCQVDALELRPGGAFVTRMSENGGEFTPHLDACILDVEPLERLVFTNALVAGWRPAAHPFMTAVITLREHDGGTVYAAHVMHKDGVDRNLHETMGFQDGWGTVIAQLAALVERGG